MSKIENFLKGNRVKRKTNQMGFIGGYMAKM